MKDARLDVPGAAPSSSVDAYEEDWYRSLRALAERRRTELERFEDEEPQTEAAAPAAEERERPAAADDTAPDDPSAVSFFGGLPPVRARSPLEPPDPAPVAPEVPSEVAAEGPEPARSETTEGLGVAATDLLPAPWAPAAPAEEAVALLRPEPDVAEPAAVAEPEPVAVGEPTEPVAVAEPSPESATVAEPEVRGEVELELASPGPSLASRDAAERRDALAALGHQEPSPAELDTVAALILDPEAEIRRLAIETLARTPTRLDDTVVRQALQDPDDEVRAAAVRAAGTRGIRDLPLLAPLVEARRSPETHRTVLELLPRMLGGTHLTPEALDPLLLAIAQMQPGPDDAERTALSEIAASVETSLLIDGLTLPDLRRLGAVRLLSGDRSPTVLRAMAGRAGDPLEEVRRAGLAAAAEIGRAKAEALAVESEALAVESEVAFAEPPDIGQLAAALRGPDPQRVERALTALADVNRPDVVSWCRERLDEGDPDSVALVASVAAVLDLGEIGVELLGRGAALPEERRRPVVEALAGFPDPSRLAGFIAVVPPDLRADAVHLMWEAAGRRVLPDLRALLADPAVDVRIAVIGVAADADDPASMEAVAPLTSTDASPDVRAAAVRAVARNEGSLPRLIRALGDADPHVRQTAVESMPPTPASEVGPVLAQAITDLDEQVRLAAIERLANVPDPALAWSALRQCRPEERDHLLGAFRRCHPGLLVDMALERLNSPDRDERRLAVEAAGWGDNQAAVEAAIRALGDPAPDIRRTAVDALGRLRERSAVAALGKALADPDAEVRIGAVRALGVTDDEAVLSFLVAVLKDPDLRVRETASQVLTEWSSPAVAKRLAGVLAVPSLRDSAADLLRRIGPTSVELLIDVLLQGNADLRATVGPLLQQIVGIEEFLGRMDSLEAERRLRATEALAAMAGPRAIDALIRSLSDPDERIRVRATKVLGELGDPIAADPIRRLVDDPVPDVSAAARQALAVLGAAA